MPKAKLPITKQPGVTRWAWAGVGRQSVHAYSVLPRALGCLPARCLLRARDDQPSHRNCKWQLRLASRLASCIKIPRTGSCPGSRPSIARQSPAWRVGFATRPHRFPGCILGLSSEHCTHRAPHAATHRLATRGCSGAADGRVEVLSCGGVCRWRLLPCSCTSPLNIRCSGIAA